ncbi:MAG: SH3 domain-containing protein, partial [Chloroflexota bacterium]
GGYGANNLIPFAPDYDELLGTVDGFVLVDYEGGEVKFSNTLAFDAFTPTIGNVIYTTESSNFRVAYITPMGTQFTLPGLATPPDVVPAIPVADDISAPSPSCSNAPAPRLTVGNNARVMFMNGVPLNVRTAPSGTLIMQISQGSVVNVVGGAICSQNYYWWNIQFELQGVTVSGWAAEGDSERYYLEPYSGDASEGVVLPAATPMPEVTQPVLPTATTVLEIAPPVQPTATVPLEIAPPIQPTATVLLEIAPPVFSTMPPGFDAIDSND